MRVEGGLRRSLRRLLTGRDSLDRPFPPLFPPLLGPLLSPNLRQTVPDALRGDGGFLQGPFSESFEAVATLGAASTLGRGIREPRQDETLVLQPVQRNVNRPERNRF